MPVNAKNPSSILYWNDLANDDLLKSCSRAARGLWTTECLPKAASMGGVVVVGNHPSIWDQDLPRLLANSGGGTAAEVLDLLTELVQSGAASVDDSGRIYNRRMARDQEISEVRSKVGKLGAAAKHAVWQKSGKGGGKQGGKTAEAESDASHGNHSENRGSSQSDPQQTSGKTLPSSLTSLSSLTSKKVSITTNGTSIERPTTGMSAPAGGDAGASNRSAKVDREHRILSAWNAAADIVNEELGHTEWPRINGMTPKREKLIAALLKVHAIESVEVALDHAMSNPWARGETERTNGHADWRFNFDYFLRMDAFTRFLEQPRGPVARRPAVPTTGRMAALHNVRERLRAKERANG